MPGTSTSSSRGVVVTCGVHTTDRDRSSESGNAESVTERRACHASQSAAAAYVRADNVLPMPGGP